LVPPDVGGWIGWDKKKTVNANGLPGVLSPVSGEEIAAFAAQEGAALLTERSDA
jgi:hypothetical protein